MTVGVTLSPVAVKTRHRLPALLRVLIIWLGSGLCITGIHILGVTAIDLVGGSQRDIDMIPGLIVFDAILSVFSVTGSAMLFAVHAILRRLGASPNLADLALLAGAAVLGACMMAAVSLPIGMMAVGGVYAVLTAAAWVAFARLFAYGRRAAPLR